MTGIDKVKSDLKDIEKQLEVLKGSSSSIVKRFEKDINGLEKGVDTVRKVMETVGKENSWADNFDDISKGIAELQAKSNELYKSLSTSLNAGINTIRYLGGEFKIDKLLDMNANKESVKEMVDLIKQLEQEGKKLGRFNAQFIKERSRLESIDVDAEFRAAKDKINEINRRINDYVKKEGETTGKYVPGYSPLLDAPVEGGKEFLDIVNQIEHYMRKYNEKGPNGEYLNQALRQRGGSIDIDGVNKKIPSMKETLKIMERVIKAWDDISANYGAESALGSRGVEQFNLIADIENQLKKGDTLEDRIKKIKNVMQDEFNADKLVDSINKIKDIAKILKSDNPYKEIEAELENIESLQSNLVEKSSTNLDIENQLTQELSQQVDLEKQKMHEAEKSANVEIKNIEDKLSTLRNTPQRNLSGVNSNVIEDKIVELSDLLKDASLEVDSLYEYINKLESGLSDNKGLVEFKRNLSSIVGNIKELTSSKKSSFNKLTGSEFRGVFEDYEETEYNKIQTKVDQLINKFKGMASIELLDDNAIANVLKLEEEERKLEEIKKRQREIDRTKDDYRDTLGTIEALEKEIKLRERLNKFLVGGAKDDRLGSELIKQHDKLSKYRLKLEGFGESTDDLKPTNKKYAEVADVKVGGGTESKIVDIIADLEAKIREINQKKLSVVDKNQLNQLEEAKKYYEDIVKLAKEADSVEFRGKSIEGLRDKIANAIEQMGDLREGLVTEGRESFALNKIDQLDGLLENISNLKGNAELMLEKANTSNIKSFNELYNAYNNVDNILNKVIASSNRYKRIYDDESSRIASKRVREDLQSVKDYVSNVEAETGKKMPLVDQIAYYKQAVQRFKQGSAEYIEVLKLLRKAEADYKKQSENNWTQISNTIQSVSNFINKSINKIVSAIRTGFAIIRKVVSGTIKVIVGIRDTITRLLGLFGNFGNRLKQAFGLGISGSYNTNKAFNTLKMTATELYHRILLIKNGFEQLFNNQLIQKASQLYGAVYALKTVTNNELTKDTIDWANKLEYAFGLSAKDLIANLGEINTLIRGLGMSEKDAALASKNLVMIGNHLAAIGHYGGDVAGVQTAIISGLKGETEAIDNLGISVRASEMNQFLDTLRKQGGEFANIGKRFEDLNEEARVYVRYAAIIKQYTDVYNMEQYAESLETVTGRVGLLKRSFSSLGTTIGQLFLKALAGVAKYLIVLIKFIETKVNALAEYLTKKFNLDLDINVSEQMNGGADAAKKLNKNLDKTKEKLEDINKTADGGLYDFDTVKGLGSGDSGKGLDDAFDYSKLMTSALDELERKANEATESYFDKLNRKVKESISSWKTKFNEFVNEATGRKIDLSFGFDKDKAKQDIEAIKENIKNALSNLGILITDIVATILDDTKAGRILNSVIELVKNLTEMLNELFKTLKIIFDYFYDSHLSEFFKKLVDNINNGVKGASDKIKNITEALKELQEAFSDPNATDKDSMLNMLYEKYPVLKHIIGIVKNLTGIVGELYRNVIKPLLKDLKEFMKSQFLPWLNEKLAQLREWVSKNSDKLKEFAKVLGGEVWKYFKMFVELVGKLIDFIVKHPNEVVGFLKALVAIKFATWLTNGVIGLAKFVKGWKEFAGLFTGTKGAVDGVKKVGALSKMGGLVKGSGILTGAGASTASGILMTSAMGAVGAGMGISDASKLYKRRDELFGAEEGSTMSAKVSTVLGGFVGGNHGGLADETASAGKKAKNVAMNSLKGAALGGAIGSVIPGVGTAIGAAVGGVVGTITGAIGGENISRAVNGAWEGIKGLVGKQLNSIKDAATDAGGWIKDRLVEAKNWASDSAAKAANAWENAIPKIRRSLDKIGGLFKGLWGSIGPMLSKVGNFLFGKDEIKIKTIPSLDYTVMKENSKNNVATMVDGRLELLTKTNTTGGILNANNNELVRAIAKSNYDAVYRAFLEVVNKTGGFGDTINNFNIGQGGVNVVDERTWKIIANKVDPYLSTRGKNGANTGFVLGR